MQKITLDNFLQNITNIREYIKHIELVNGVVSNNKHFSSTSLISFNAHLTSFRTEKKIFEYKAIIISLYGILENYISILIKEHVKNISILVQDYQKLPDEFKKSHFDLSIKLISIISENRYIKYEHLEKEDILSKLNLCISKPLDFKLNSDAFIPISGNLKHSKIIEAFNPLNIKLEDMLKTNNNFSIYLKNLFGEDITKQESKILFNKIDDLVIRRNELAHGNNIDDILDFTIFDEYIEFIEKYGKAIFYILREKEIEYESIHSYEQIKKEDVKKVYRKSILDCDVENTEIRRGDCIIIKDTDNTFLKKEILDIHLNGKSCNNLIIINKTNIGIKLDQEIKESQKFYIKTIEQEMINTIYHLTVIY